MLSQFMFKRKTINIFGKEASCRNRIIEPLTLRAARRRHNEAVGFAGVAARIVAHPWHRSVHCNTWAMTYGVGAVGVFLKRRQIQRMAGKNGSGPMRGKHLKAACLDCDQSRGP